MLLGQRFSSLGENSGPIRLTDKVLQTRHGANVVLAHMARLTSLRRVRRELCTRLRF
jgi:hypothetical protein